MEQLQEIQSKIYEIRGQKVMLDRDLAEMYGVQTKVLNQAVKRNIERFPEDFMFQLTTEETKYWKSQIVTSNAIKMGLRRNPYAFTELGVAMLSSVINSKIAIQINTKRHQRRNCHAIGINQPILGRITDEKEKRRTTPQSNRVYSI